MKMIRIAFVFVTVLFALSLLASCTGLALSGPKRYKIELLSQGAAIDREIDENGAISDASVRKLEKSMNKWREEMKDKGSFKKVEEIMALIKDAQADPDQAYRKNQEVKSELVRLRETLKTEIED